VDGEHEPQGKDAARNSPTKTNFFITNPSSTPVLSG
jgi:hypothetical protein